MGQLDPDKREQWEAQLIAPFPDEDARVVQPTEDEVESEGAMFMAAMAQHKALTGG